MRCSKWNGIKRDFAQDLMTSQGEGDERAQDSSQSWALSGDFICGNRDCGEAGGEGEESTGLCFEYCRLS